MPGGSGMSLLRMLRMFDAVTPFVLITAYGDRATHRPRAALAAPELGRLKQLDICCIFA